MTLRKAFHTWRDRKQAWLRSRINNNSAAKLMFEQYAETAFRRWHEWVVFNEKQGDKTVKAAKFRVARSLRCSFRAWLAVLTARLEFELEQSVVADNLANTSFILAQARLSNGACLMDEPLKQLGELETASDELSVSRISAQSAWSTSRPDDTPPTTPKQAAQHEEDGAARTTNGHKIGSAAWRRGLEARVRAGPGDHNTTTKTTRKRAPPTLTRARNIASVNAKMREADGRRKRRQREEQALTSDQLQPSRGHGWSAIMATPSIRLDEMTPSEASDEESEYELRGFESPHGSREVLF